MCLLIKTTAAVQKFNYTKHALNLCTELNVLISTVWSYDTKVLLTGEVGCSCSLLSSVFSGINDASPGSLCLFMMDKICVAVLSESTTMWKSLKIHVKQSELENCCGIEVSQEMFEAVFKDTIIIIWSTEFWLLLLCTTSCIVSVTM